MDQFSAVAVWSKVVVMKRHSILMLFACLLISACGSQSEPKREATPPATPPAAAASTPAAPDRAEYPLKGTVVSVEKYSDRLTVKHEAIPGFMGAMTMPYSVKPAHAADDVSAGDEITA